MNTFNYHNANWPAPLNIRALTTTRKSGESLSPFAANNLGLHVEDCEAHVLNNRLLLKNTLGLPSEPEWLEQTHSATSIVVEEDEGRLADAAITRAENRVLAILTADCLPILLCNRKGTEIAAIHAGWKGLYQGIVASTISKMHSQADEILAWCGPAICQQCYEVDIDFYHKFIQAYPFLEASFQQKNDKCLASLTHMAEMLLKQSGVVQVFQSNLCTFEQGQEFYSWRRDKKTGRMASLIWFQPL